MNLDHNTFRHILCKIFFGSYEDEHLNVIIPKQGNWLNPQSIGKTATWIGYLIRDNYSLVAPRTYSYVNEEGVPCVEDVVTMCAIIDLQFLGVNAEQFAQSVLHWDSRPDVKDALRPVVGDVKCRRRRVVAVPYWQDGGNNISSFNVTVEIIWANVDTNIASYWPLDEVPYKGEVVIDN